MNDCLLYSSRGQMGELRVLNCNGDIVLVELVRGEKGDMVPVSACNLKPNELCLVAQALQLAAAQAELYSYEATTPLSENPS